MAPVIKKVCVLYFHKFSVTISSTHNRMNVNLEFVGLSQQLRLVQFLCYLFDNRSADYGPM